MNGPSHGPKPSDPDRACATRLAQQIVSFGRGSVRQVIMIGSRAKGTARPDSDLDLVVIVERPAEEKPWGGDEFTRAAESLRHALGPQNARLDISVRTIDRYAEARDVPGGAEYPAAHGGYVLFEAPPTRAPVVRTAPENVRREFVSSWVHHALLAIESFTTHSQRPIASVARMAVERLVTALLIHHKVAPEPFAEVVEFAWRIPQPQAKSIGVALASRLEAGALTPASTMREARAVLSYLMRDPLQARVLRKAQERLANAERA